MSELLPTPPPMDQPIISMGEIGVSHQSVFLPHGRFPIRGTTWSVIDASRSEEKVSTAGIVLAILFFWFCLLGLLFLLMRDRRTVGYINVTVQGPGFQHTAQIPAHSPRSIYDVTGQVNWARSVAAGA